jgi:tRNA pseudouridine13 synthase
MYKLKQLPEDFIVEELPLYEAKEKGKYTYFVLEKKEYNTEKVIQSLAKYFNIPRKNFGYAGTKDKYAVTKQYCSVKGKIKDKDFSEFKIKVLGYLDNPISLGDHKGNKFTITIRNIKKLPKRKKEFINYFGEQRFSKHNVDIGLSILKKDFQKAASLIDYPGVQGHLQEKPNDYIGAIQKVPFKILKIYVHSVQSFFWNKVAEKVDAEFIPLISFDTEFENKEIEKEYQKILGEYDITLRDFAIRKISNLTPLGNTRKRISEIKNLKIGKLEDDELNNGMKKVNLEFILEKGCYATEALKAILA